MLMLSSRSCTLLVLLFLFPCILSAQVRLPPIFTDNMVLQQKTDVTIWGWSDPGKRVTLTASWAKGAVSTTADASGKWKVKMATPAAGGPYTLRITDGKPFELKNILLGEVWFLGGQSNMEMPMKGFRSLPVQNSNETVLRSTNEQIRLYTVPRLGATTPRDTSRQAVWKVAEPSSVADFSAAGYYFGKLLYDMLHVPIGLLSDNYGGSYIEAWMSPEDLKPFPEIKIPGLNDPLNPPSRTATALYNGMLYPVMEYTVKGVLWYQGEQNHDRPDQYEKLLPAMVSEWRRSFTSGEFPFYFAQIAPYRYGAAGAPADKVNNTAFFRDAQRRTVDRISNSGMAVLLDLGEENNIHPMRKQEVGTRLALLALAKTYGLGGFGSESPDYERMTLRNDTAVLGFRYAANGLTSYGKPLNLFEAAGDDRVFHAAKATIAGSSVLVSAPGVPKPVAVRYAFRDFTTAELFGNDGLPVSSFRTDDWEK